MTASGPSASPRRGLLSLGTFFGVPLFLAPSWLLVAVLFTVVYGPALDDAVPGLSASGAYAAATGFSVLVALCVLAHELGHTAMSLALGHPVRRVVIFLMGGVSEVDAQLARPRDEFLVAAAGPLVSVLITVGAGVGDAFTDSTTLLGAVVTMLFWSNAALTVFNLLPGLPLDGGRLLRAALHGIGVSGRLSTVVAAWCGRLLAVGMVVLAFTVHDPEWGTTSAIISGALGAYLWVGASQSQRLGALLDRIPSLRAAELLRPGVLVEQDATVADALDRAWTSGARGIVTTDATGRPLGIVDEARVGAVPPQQRPWTGIATVARPLGAGLVLPVGLVGEDLVARLRATPSREYFVVHPDGTPAGILATADVAAALEPRR